MAASADARISTSLPSHPKTRKLIKRLGAASAWHLVVLFLFVAVSKSDGDLAGMTDEDIELAADWSGDEGAFVEALAAVGFLDGPANARSIHDWADHNPWAAGAAARSEKSRFAALSKQYGRAEAERQMPAYAARIRPAGGDDAKGGAKAPVEKAAGKPDAPSGDANGTPNEESGTASGTPPAVPDSASGTASGTKGQCPVSDTVTVSVSVSDTVTSPTQDQELDSLRSSSSPAAPPTTPAEETDEEKKARKLAEASQRLSVHTANAMAAYNAILAKPHGLLAKATKVGIEERRSDVRRCLRIAARICESQYGDTAITPQFWEDYFHLVALDEFKSGRQKGGQGHSNWRPGFEYLTRPETMTEVFEHALDGDDGEDAAHEEAA